MFKYSKDGISVLSVLDARRAKKSGLFPVKIQVIYNRKQKYYSTGQELSKEDWANLAESNEQYSTRNGYHSMLLGIEAFAGKDIPFSTITVDSFI